MTAVGIIGIIGIIPTCDAKTTHPMESLSFAEGGDRSRVRTEERAVETLQAGRLATQLK